MYWLSKCQKYHEQCNTVGVDRKDWCPTRLLDVGKHELESDDFIQLIDCRNSPLENPSYLTLSHCWGYATFVCLNRSTLEDLRTGISASLLPPTFRDAITIARRLQVQYLWIDSLCIMQDRDDSSDWLHEAALMEKVYSNAFLNISATGASDSSKGLFTRRNPRTLRPPEIELSLDGLKSSKSKVSTKYRLARTLFWRTELSQAPLMKRGWVLQERLLAPRVLHFAHNQLLWECCEMDASETYPEELPPALAVETSTHFKRLNPLVDGPRLRQYGLQEADSRFFAHELWKRIAEGYSKGLLTNGGDKLIALSGIAKKISSMLVDEYVVGMWRFCLESQLLWWINHCQQANHEPSTRPGGYRAPSFSWASVDGMVTTGDFTDKGILIEVTDLKIDYVTNDVTGPVKGGCLYLKGSLKKLRLERDPLTTGWVTMVNGVQVQSGKSSPAVLLDVDQANFNEENDREALYCMPARAPFARYQFFICLILKSIGEQSKRAGEFLRLGVLLTSQQPLMRILLDSHDEEKFWPCMEYDGRDRRHQICLI